MINAFKNFSNLFFVIILFFNCRTVKAGLNNFTELIYVEDWLIERKVDLKNNEVKCRASLPINATWFGARVRLGANDELITPGWIRIEEDKLLDSTLIKVKHFLDDCRSGFIFLPDNS